MLQSKFILNLNDLKVTSSALNTYVHISAHSRAVYRVGEHTATQNKPVVGSRRDCVAQKDYASHIFICILCVLFLFFSLSL